ncbi:endoplasmic reticulum resident protein 44-like [Sycon ciliatum]|uniref:endoplasmic reticulum resident protein 44-like n=1 Tax=Sycon ciliatum TaxID=27933 RepID=UPI0020A89377|eukprot:scpid58478/ scgid25331/ Endoplasmic reticulum resident protein 44; Thioredoxin domain-containing protein 4
MELRLGCHLLLSAFLVHFAQTAVVELDDNNFDSIISGNQLVIVNFYANWCRFSQMLTPIFEEASNKIQGEFSTGVALGRVNCEAQVNTAQKFSINKYPTLKVFRNGQALKKEYRGQRSPDAFLEFVRSELTPSIKDVAHHELGQHVSKRSIVGFFPHKEGTEYAAFDKASTVLKDDCPFISVIRPGDVSIGIHQENEVDAEHKFDGDHSDHQSMIGFVTDRCIPLVREITFANAEGLTEEGLPFLILFHHPDDTQSLQMFERQVRQDLITERSAMNFIHADGLQFSHPLHHLGKSKHDLPVLAIDSFRHMYLFPGNFQEDLAKPSKLRQFVADLHSGKLHREFHYGPDPTEQPQLEQQAPADPMADIEQGPNAPGIPSSDEAVMPSQAPVVGGGMQEHQFRAPPKSAFAKLAPGKNRYTFAGNHDEL